MSDQRNAGATADELVTQLWDCVAKVVGQDLRHLPESTPVDEVGLDSVLLIEVIAEFEEAIGEELPLETLEGMVEVETIGDVLNVVRETFAGKSAGA